MNRWLYVLLSALIAVACLGGFPPASAASTSMEALREATVNIGVIGPPEKGSTAKSSTQSLGAGVLFRRKGAPKDVVYLVTAKHVLQTVKTNHIGLRFAWFYDDEQKVHKQIIVHIENKNGPGWKALENADLACIALTLPASLIGRDEVPTMSEADLAPVDDYYVGASVLVFGYPDVAGTWDTGICRQGIIAALASREPEANRFLIDCSTYPGNSGGPVYKSSFGLNRKGKGSMRLHSSILGIVVAAGQRREAVFTGQKAMTNPEGDGKEPVQAEVKTAIGIVEPASRIRSLLRLFD